MDPSLAALLRRQDEVITRWQAVQHVTIKALRHLVESGRWRRVHDGVFTAHSGALRPRQHAWAAVLGAGGDRWPRLVCLGGLSALCAWGLRAVAPDAVHVLVPANRQARPRRGAVLHRTRVVPDMSGGLHLQPPATMPGRSLVDAVQWARSEREARLIVASSFQQGLVTLVDVERAAGQMPNAKRRRLLLTTAEDCAGGSHSLAELDLLALCRRSRLPRPTRQLQRRDRQGRLRFLDAVFEPWRVAVEVDGAHHLLVGQMWDDAVRANALELDGYVVPRYPAFALRTEPGRIAAEIAEALRKAGWAPGAV